MASQDAKIPRNTILLAMLVKIYLQSVGIYNKNYARFLSGSFRKIKKLENFTKLYI